MIDPGDHEIILIDPGDPDISAITNWLNHNTKQIRAVLLTHEHADHCAGVNALHEMQSFNLFCSQACYTTIGNSKQNLSFYHSDIETFEVKIPARIIQDGESFLIGELSFTFMETPGHSPGSMCIFAGNAVFTGDTLLNNIKTPLTFPHSNRKQYAASIEKLKNLLKPGMIIHPGHGEAFEWGRG